MSKFQYLKDNLKDCNNLCRVGGFRDGGYVLPFSSIINADTLISGGVGSNARFEIDVLDINPKIKVFPIDLSFSIWRMFARTFYHFFKKNTNWRVSLIENITVLILIKKFSVIKKFINKAFDFYNINHYLNINSKKIIIKLDIEGSEYEILESLLSFEEKIEAICIEFHNLEIKMNHELLQKYIKNTTLELVYVSVNESSIENDIPNILEISLCNSKNLINKINYLQVSYDPETTLLKTL